MSKFNQWKRCSDKLLTNTNKIIIGICQDVFFQYQNCLKFQLPNVLKEWNILLKIWKAQLYILESVPPEELGVILQLSGFEIVGMFYSETVLQCV